MPVGTVLQTSSLVAQAKPLRPKKSPDLPSQLRGRPSAAAQREEQTYAAKAESALALFSTSTARMWDTAVLT